MPAVVVNAFGSQRHPVVDEAPVQQWTTIDDAQRHQRSRAGLTAEPGEHAERCGQAHLQLNARSTSQQATNDNS